MDSQELNSSNKVSSGKNQEPAHAINHFPVAYELEIHRIIQLDAYYRAEKDGFKSSPLDYWLAAENAVHRRV